jgi:hypothetical protein
VIIKQPISRRLHLTVCPHISRRDCMYLGMEKKTLKLRESRRFQYITDTVGITQFIQADVPTRFFDLEMLVIWDSDQAPSAWFTAPNASAAIFCEPRNWRRTEWLFERIRGLIRFREGGRRISDRRCATRTPPKAGISIPPLRQNRRPCQVTPHTGKYRAIPPGQLLTFSVARWESSSSFPFLWTDCYRL